MTVDTALWRAGEHLDQVVVKTIVELTLEGPLELRMIQIAGMKIEVVGVYGYGRTLEFDDELHPTAFGARGESKHRVLVLRQLRNDTIETGGCGFRHGSILSESEVVKTCELYPLSVVLILQTAIEIPGVASIGRFIAGFAGGGARAP